MLTPGALSGTTQVIDSFSCPAATGCRLPHQVSWQNTEAVPNIFRPLMVTPLSSSLITRSVWRRVSLVVRRTERTPALWIGDSVGGENIVAAHVLVIIADVVAEALTDAVEHRRIHHQPANITRKVVGRATEQTVRPRGNSTVGLEPSLQILTRPRQQEIGREG